MVYYCNTPCRKHPRMIIYGFWNNKGGTGKTHLAFQTACGYAMSHPQSDVLAIDMCPQADLSELLLGGLINHGSRNLLLRHGEPPRASIGGYFQKRLSTPYAVPSFVPQDFLTVPHVFNSHIPENLHLVCGDPLLELQARAMATLANTQIPGTNTWISVVDWLRDFLAPLRSYYKAVYIDMNPSFSLYTQIALSAANSLIMPVLADGSSRRGLQNAFSLIHGVKITSSPMYSEHSFATRMPNAQHELPNVKLIVQNRVTRYMLRDSSPYTAVMNTMFDDLKKLMFSNPGIFAFDTLADGFTSVRDLHTAGIVSAARGCPLSKLTPGRKSLQGRRVQVEKQELDASVESIDKLIQRIRAI